MRVAALHTDGEPTEVASLPYRRERRPLTVGERRARRSIAIGILSLKFPEWGPLDLAAIFGVSERTIFRDLGHVQGVLEHHLRASDAD